MIVVAGLTPAWQQILRFDAFRPGEVNRAHEVHWCASGKVLNVGIALAHLGAHAETISLLGGPAREAIEREFLSLGIRRRWIETHWATRICTTILDEAAGQTTELVENAGPVTPGELAQFQSIYAQSAAAAQFAVLTGSLPRGVPNTLFRDLLALTPGRAILDVRGEELLQSLVHKPWLVKPNREELAQTVGRQLSTDVHLHDAMRELNERGANWVLVTNGREPAWASSQGQLFRFVIPRVNAVNPIGSGDCVAAGIAWALSLGKEPLAAIRCGLAAGVENVGQLLPARVDPEFVARRADAIEIDPK